MWVRCGACRTRYRLKDELVDGRRLKLRCRRCAGLIAVDGTGEGLRAAPRPPPAPPPPGWFVLAGGDLGGPFYLSELRRRVLRSLLAADDYVWKPGMDGWQPAGEVLELRAIVDIDAFPRRSAVPELPPPLAPHAGSVEGLPDGAPLPPYLKPVARPRPPSRYIGARWPVWLAMAGPVVVAISIVAVVALERHATSPGAARPAAVSTTSSAASARSAPVARSPGRCAKEGDRARPSGRREDRPIAIHIGSAEIRITSGTEGEITRLPAMEVRTPDPRKPKPRAPDSGPDGD